MALRDAAKDLPRRERDRRDDGGFFGKDGQREEGGEVDEVGAGAGGFEVDRQRPESESGREEIGMGEGGLNKPDRIDRCEQRGDDRDRVAGERAGEGEDSEQCRGGDHAEEGARALDRKSGDVPPGGEQDGGERRVGVGEGGMRDQRAGAEEIERGRDVVAGFVPEPGQREQRIMGEIDRNEEERIEDVERERTIGWSGDLGETRRHSGLVDGRTRYRDDGRRGRGGGRDGLEDELAEGLFVLSEIVAKHVPESLCLLGAEVDGLKVIEVDLGGGRLLHGAEDKLEVPHRHAHLDRVGIGFAVVVGLVEADLRLRCGVVRIVLAHGLYFGSSIVGAKGGT